MSHAPGNCLPFQRQTRRKVSRQNRIYRHLVPAVADAWSSSKSSKGLPRPAHRRSCCDNPGGRRRDPAQPASPSGRSHVASAHRQLYPHARFHSSGLARTAPPETAFAADITQMLALRHSAGRISTARPYVRHAGVAPPKSLKPHNTRFAHRGFVHGRFPYAGPCQAPRLRCRHPKTFTKADEPRRREMQPVAPGMHLLGFDH